MITEMLQFVAYTKIIVLLMIYISPIKETILLSTRNYVKAKHKTQKQETATPPEECH